MRLSSGVIVYFFSYLEEQEERALFYYPDDNMTIYYVIDHLVDSQSELQKLIKDGKVKKTKQHGFYTLEEFERNLIN